MKTKRLTRRRARGVVLSSLASLGLLVAASVAHAESGYVNTWSGIYPGSSSDGASCQLCHGSSTGDINPYGYAMASCNPATSGNISTRIQAAEGLNSDGDAGGFSNLEEINASTQPGWTSGQNSLWGRNNCSNQGAESAPNNVGTLDPSAVNDPPVADANGPYTGVVGVNVMFDGTGSSDPDGTIDSYDWDFGDGNTGTGSQPQHTYLTDGTFTVTLTVTDDAGDTDSATTTATIDLANQTPTADPNGPYSGTVNVPVDFDGSGSNDPDGNIVSYAWNFGDGSNGTGVNPDHTYGTSGTFTVSLTVTDNDGATDTATTEATIGEGNQPPVADANGPYGGTAGVAVTFDGSGSTDSDGTIDFYDWDFGDGNTGTGVSPTHTYAAAGTYNVTLMVTDDAGATDSDGSMADIVAAPQDPIADPNGPYSGTAGVSVTLDGSGSSDPDGGAIAAYDWDFGDGNTGTGVSPTNTYASAGTYTVTLTVVDDEGTSSAPATTTANIDVNQAPTADPNGPYTGVVDVNVMFDGTGSSDPDGTVASYDWDFGDGSTGTGASPQHAYAAADTYTVTLTVTDDLGDVSDPVSTTATIDATNQAPTADPNGPYSGTVGVPVSFDGSGSTDPDGTLVSYDWDFGDGNTGTGSSPNHTYVTSGPFTVSLTVTDDAGATDTATTTATIGEGGGNLPPVADPNGPYTGEVSVPLTFDGTGSSDPDGSIVAYDWDFGDGTVVLDAGPTPSHTYTAEGTYNVTLTVVDDAGAMDSASTTARVGVADVFLKNLRVPRELKVKKGRTVKSEVTVRGYSTEFKQDATVVLSAVSSSNVDVVIKPTSITKQVRPNRRGTEFEFTVLVSCNAGGRGTLDWTATIDALANADTSNDVQTKTTKVKCKGGRDDDDEDSEDDDKH